MKKQLKKILPCIMAGISGISYGNINLENSNNDTDDSITISENKNNKQFNENKEMVRDSLSSNTSFSQEHNFKRNRTLKGGRKLKAEDYDDPDRIQINLEYMGSFSKSHDNSEEDTINNQTVIMPAFRWTGTTNGIPFWNGITNVGGNLISATAFGSYVGTQQQTQVLTQRDEDLQQMKANNAAGIKNIAYTYTLNSTRNLDLVYSDIDNFVNFYGRENIQGYFIDEIMSGGTQAQIDYMANIYNYIKTKYPEMTVIANNGWGISDGIAPYADIWMTQEVSADEYINRYRTRTSEFEQDSSNSAKILHVIYNATPEQYEEIIKLSRERNAGNLFITSDTNAYPSGYDDLPTYFEDLMMTINNFTPTEGTLFSAERQSSDKVTVEMPRSKVDLDLAKAVRNTTYKNLENTKDNQYKIDIAYMRNYGGDYKDKDTNVEYESESNGVILNASKDFGKFTLGTAFGYQKSDVAYKEKYTGVKEKITSYQIGLNGKYEFTDNIDLTGNLIYSTNRHKFKTGTGLGAINDAEYKSKILDFNTRLGYKFLFDGGYVKPYVGLGITKVKEDEIDKLKFSEASKTAMSTSLGVYGEKTFGKLGLFGNLEYEQRLGNKSYHAARERSQRYEIAALKYAGGIINAETGIKYNFTDNFGMKASYELEESKNSIVKLGFHAEF